MFHSLILTSCVKFVRSNQNKTLVRYVRGVSRRNTGPKLLEGKIKTVKNYDDPPRIQSYKDFINSVKETELEDEVAVEKAMLEDDYQGDVIERCDKYFDLYESKENALKANIKKKIIGRKYFQLFKETNLLTNAAKEQIRFLHKSDPLVWNYKALSECFPISEEGAKKLLKCNFTLTCPKRIKEHDEKVAALWKILKSGSPTDLITPLTQKLYKEGKLVDDYFSGNPNLPTAPPAKKEIEIKRKKKVGEFSAIVQTYVEYEKRKLITDGKENIDENQLSLRNNSVLESSQKKNEIDRNFRQYKFVAEEDNNRDPEVYISRKKRNINISSESEIPFSQFKEILRDETSADLDPKHKNEYDKFIMQQTSLTDDHSSSNKTLDTQDCFLKISKYDKSCNVEAMFEKSENVKNVYTYDKKLGYQYPVGKNFKLSLPPMQRKKEKLHKAGKRVYDENGEFLYKIP